MEQNNYMNLLFKKNSVRGKYVKFSKEGKQAMKKLFKQVKKKTFHHLKIFRFRIITQKRKSMIN